MQDYWTAITSAHDITLHAQADVRCGEHAASTVMMRAAIVALTLATVYAAITRLIWLNHLPSLSADEAENGVLAMSVAAGRSFPIHGAQPYFGPFFLYIMALNFKFFGTSVLTMRLASALASISLVPTVYFLGKVLYDESTGLWSALYAAVMPLLLTHGRVAFDVALLPFFSAASVLCFVLGRRQGSRWLTALGVVSLLCAAQLHPTQLFVFAGFAAFLVLSQWPVLRSTLGQRWTWLFLGVVAIVSMPSVIIFWQMIAINAMRRIQDTAAPVSVWSVGVGVISGYAVFLRALLQYLFSGRIYEEFAGSVASYATIGGLLAVVEAGFFIAGVALALRRRTTADLLVLCCCGAAMLLTGARDAFRHVVGRHGSVLDIPGTERYVLTMIPFVLLISASAFSEAQRRASQRRYLRLCVLLFGVVLLTHPVLAYGRYFKPMHETGGRGNVIWMTNSVADPKEEATRFLLAHHAKSLILTQYWWIQWPLNFYGRDRLQLEMLPMVTRREDFESFAQRHTGRPALFVCFAGSGVETIYKELHPHARPIHVSRRTDGHPVVAVYRF